MGSNRPDCLGEPIQRVGAIVAQGIWPIPLRPEVKLHGRQHQVRSFTPGAALLRKALRKSSKDTLVCARTAMRGAGLKAWP